MRIKGFEKMVDFGDVNFWQSTKPIKNSNFPYIRIYVLKEYGKWIVYWCRSTTNGAEGIETRQIKINIPIKTKVNAIKTARLLMEQLYNSKMRLLK